MHGQVNLQFLSKGVLLMLDTPADMEFGIDNTAWRVQHKFKGIKMIPLGTHYMHFALADQGHKFRTGRFLHFSQQKKIIVLKWNSQVQDYLHVTASQEASYVDGVKSFYFDCYLGVYPKEKTAIWAESSNYISKQVLTKLDPVQTIYSLDQQYTTTKPNQEQEHPQAQAYSLDDQPQQPEDQTIPKTSQGQPPKQQQQPNSNSSKQTGKFRCVRGTIYYSEIPKKLSANSAEITQISLDKSKLLQRMLLKDFNNKQDLLLGQIQYAFVVFLLGEDLESFEHWKRLLNLVVMSQTSAYTRPSLFMKFIVVLFTQLKQFPKDFFLDELSKDSFLVGCLRRLLQYEKDPMIDIKLRKRITKLKQLVQKNFGFIVPQQEEEDMPVVVDEDSEYF